MGRIAAHLVSGISRFQVSGVRCQFSACELRVTDYGIL
jgi:hypothetical protein